MYNEWKSDVLNIPKCVETLSNWSKSIDLYIFTCLILAQNILIIVSTCLKHGSKSNNFSKCKFPWPDLKQMINYLVVKSIINVDEEPDVIDSIMEGG